MSGFRLALMLLVPVLLVTARDARPRGTKKDIPPEVATEQAVTAHRKKIAGQHRSLARWCRGKKHHRTAHAHLKLAFHLAPDLGAVRIDLGYKKVKGEWVLKKPVDLGSLKNSEPPGEDYVSRDAKIRKARVAGLLKIAKKAAGLGLEDRCRELRVRALRVDRESDAARRALGHTKIGDRWFAPWEAALVPATVVCRREERPSAAAQAVDARLAGWRAGRFLLEGLGAEDEFRSVLEATCRADALAHVLFTGDPHQRSGASCTYTLLGNEAQFNRSVEQSGYGPAEVSACKQIGVLSMYGSHVFAATLSGSAGMMADYCAHDVADSVLMGDGQEPPSWLLSGFTDYISGRAAGTMLTRYCTLEASAGLRVSADKEGALVWRLRLRNLALLGEDPQTGILFSSALTGLSLEDVMKAWSLMGFLLERDRGAFSGFLRKSLEVGSAVALDQAYGLDADGLDAAWREFVIEHG